MSNPLVTINLVVLNGEKYIRHCLDAILAQTYPNEFIELNILDNGSSDETKNIINDFGFRISDFGFARFNFIESKLNLGMWPGQEELLKHSSGKYIVTSAVDIILDKDFIKNAVEIMEKDEKIGALQPKIYKFDLRPTSDVLWTSDVKVLPSRTSQIDTCGFQIFKSRRVINIGHGEEDNGQFSEQKEIFAVEGAVPVFRKEALESCRIFCPSTSSEPSGHQDPSEIIDHNYFWYGDDLDLAWRMRLFGWKEMFAPNVIAWHDRQTTKTLKKTWFDYFSRIPLRKQIPIKKRRLDWRNMRWTLVKNDYTINILKDLPWIAAREVVVLGYMILFEPGVLKEIPAFFKYLPKMLRKRGEIMRRAIATPKEIRKWIN